MTVDRSHGFFKPATILLSVKRVWEFVITRSLCLPYGQGTPIHPFHFTDRPPEAQREGLVQATQPGLLHRPALGPAIVLIPLLSAEGARGQESNVCVLVAWLCLTPSYPMDCSLPGSSVHGILQARILEWVAISFSTERSQYSK